MGKTEARTERFVCLFFWSKSTVHPGNNWNYLCSHTYLNSCKLGTSQRGELHSTSLPLQRSSAFYGRMPNSIFII